MDDNELLRRYTDENSEDAFRLLVERHAGLVYGTAMRQLHRAHQADEVAHAVFSALARKAATLRAGTVLAGWLYRASRFATAKLQRDEERRQRRQREAAMIMTVQSSPDPEEDWEQIVPLLDAELESLAEKDRSAVLMRFFENLTFKQVGEGLGTSEDAAKMRVARALDKLRRRFQRRGITLSLAALAGAFSSKSVAATSIVPPGLVASVSKASLSPGLSNGLVAAIIRRLLWWKLKPLVISLIAIVAACTITLLIRDARNSPSANPPAAGQTWPPQR
jgi:RNA polymerase sigma factor (sigma-70 family)